MRFFTTVLLLLCCCFAAKLCAQNIVLLDSGHKVSLRGLSVVNDNVVWASGTNGTVVRSTNGGTSFEWLTVAGYEKRDFRDIEAFDDNTAVIMAVDAPAIILKTNDGGKNWKPAYTDTAKGMFLDAMNFNGNSGVVIGDPLNNYVYIAVTEDGGNTWEKLDPKGSNIKVQQDEAFFASSGTNVKLVADAVTNTNNMLIVSGGSHARLISNGKLYEMPMLQGGTSQGANSMDVLGKHAVVVGGDFAHDTVTTGNCVLFGVTGTAPVFTRPATPPHGYRSCVAFINKQQLITCGTSGVDISNDGGNNWQLISKQSYHVCQKAKHGNAVFLAGAGGRIAKLQ